jgi:hypothetical protein
MVNVSDIDLRCGLKAVPSTGIAQAWPSRAVTIRESVSAPASNQDE